MSAKINYAFLFIQLGIFLFSEASAQGPLVSYYYNPSTEMSQAECYIYHPGDSKQKIPFFTVANQNHHWAALGTKKYSKDCDVDARIVYFAWFRIEEIPWYFTQEQRMEFSDMKDQLLPSIFQIKILFKINLKNLNYSLPIPIRLIQKSRFVNKRL